MNRIAEDATRYIKTKSKELGFFYCGISTATFLEDEAPKLEYWLQKGMQGKMTYMENHFDKRLDPRKLVDGARSVVSLLFNYYPEEALLSDYKLSKYAYGVDYHHVIKDKLKEFMSAIQHDIGEVGGRVFVDSAPIMDKAWAKRAGLGWIGKNSNLINKQAGSFFFIAELILDIDLIPDGPIKDYCGTCTRCIDACPTDAIVAPYVVDGSKCISYLTIELKDQLLPTEFKGKMDNWFFGCDVCQDVCPWNRFSTPSTEHRFKLSDQLKELAGSNWQDLTHEVFQEVFRNSALKRAKFEGIQRNLNFLT